MKIKSGRQSGAWRSRWAAMGAAVAVTLGAGGMVAVNAAPSAASTFVSIDPLVRILDTRTNAGLPGPFVTRQAQTLQVTGSVPTQNPASPGSPPPPIVNAVVVPTGATSVVLNVTVIGPETNGFIAIRPGTASGTPGTSNQNFAAGSQNIANSVTVQLSSNGTINIYVEGTVREVAIDVAGYYVPAPTVSSGPPAIFAVSGGETTPVNVVLLPSGNPNQIGDELAVPAGSYRVSAKLNAKEKVGNTTILTCSISDRFPALTASGVFEIDRAVWTAFSNEEDVLSMSRVINFSGSGPFTINLSCATTGDFDVSWFSLEAMAVT